MKTLDLFLEFEAELSANLQAHPDVLGLVFVGSAADHSRFDEWSDHDFFVITENERAEALRQDLSWLPNASEIAIRPRETAHGLKVVYRDGHVLEFAVFENRELEIAAANAFLVTVDKTGDIQSRMQALADKTAAESMKNNVTEFNAEREYELFLCQLLIGVGRARRGEVLIAGQHVRSGAAEEVAASRSQRSHTQLPDLAEEPEPSHGAALDSGFAAIAREDAGRRQTGCSELASRSAPTYRRKRQAGSVSSSASHHRQTAYRRGPGFASPRTASHSVPRQG